MVLREKIQEQGTRDKEQEETGSFSSVGADPRVRPEETQNNNETEESIADSKDALNASPENDEPISSSPQMRGGVEELDDEAEGLNENKYLSSSDFDNPDKISYLGDTIGNDELENSGLTLIGDDGNYLDNLHLGETLKIKGGEGMDVLLENNRITISGEDASTTNKGISKYDNIQFNVTDGNVEIQDIYVKNSGDTIDGDLNINGNQNISGKINVNGIENSGYYTQTGTSANTFTGTSTFSNPTYSALFTGGNVGIGTTSPGAKLEIAGTTDSTQMIIRANTTQSNTNPLFQLVSVGGAELMGIHSDNEANIFVGVGAGASNDISDGWDGFYNTFIGFNAGTANTTGNSNSVLGAESLFSNTIGSYNVALGTRSLYSNTEGTSNIAIGDASLYSNTEGYSNIAIGDESLYSNIDGTSNIAIGEDSLYSNIDGGSNVAIGDGSLVENTSGSSNIAIGQYTLQGNTVGNYNIALGEYSLIDNTEGENNIGIGSGSLLRNLTGNRNVAVGVDSLMNNETGDNNVAIGQEAGFSNETGSSNVFLGYQAGYYETGSNKLFIDNVRRSSEADARTKALMYGIFDAAVANQSLTVNGALNVTGTTTLTGNLLPSTNDTYNLGSDSMRFANAWLGGETLHIGTADADEGEIGYTTSTNVMTVQSNGNLALQASSGNVGIGTTAPGAKLQVTTGTETANTPGFILRNSSGHSEADAYMSFQANDGDHGWSIGIDSSNDGFTFARSSTSIASNVYMYIDRTAGNVGIGTTNPGYKLQIDGSLSQSGGYAYLGAHNSGATYPTSSAGTMAIANNFSGGQAELNIWNTLPPSSYANTGIRFMQLLTSSTYRDLMFLHNNGNVGIGTTAPTYQLHLSTNSAGKPGGGSWTDSSDSRLKKEVTPVTNAMNKIMQLNPVQFQWINPEEHGNQTGVQGGFIAQELQSIFPGWVSEVDPQGDDRDLVDGKSLALQLPFEFNAFLVQGMKEQQLSIEAIQASLAGLTGGTEGGSSEDLSILDLRVTDLEDHLTLETGDWKLDVIEDQITGLNNEWVINNGETEIEQLKSRVAELENFQFSISNSQTISNDSNSNENDNTENENENENINENINENTNDNVVDDTPPTLQADPSQEGIKNPTDVNEQINDKLSILGIGEIDETITAFFKEIWFTAKVTFEKTVDFLDRVSFRKAMALDKNMADEVVLINGTKQIRVEFEAGFFAQKPVVTATPMNFIDGEYRVGEVSKEGFIIELDKEQTVDVSFSWHAFEQIVPE